MMRRWPVRNDEGNVSVLTLGWIVLALLALLVIAAATQVHVDRMRLASLADEAALAAAQSTSDGGYFGDVGSATASAQAGMDAAVGAWLGSDPREWVAEVAVLEVSGSSDGTASVYLGRTVYPLFDVEGLGPFRAGIDLTVEGSARGG